jgi:flavin-dependent dehydrogenase
VISPGFNLLLPEPTPIAIVGGGPAGALCAARLSQNGRRVVLFDEKLAWEKPCGGGLTFKALKDWPFLSEAAVERNWIQECELIAPSGRRAAFVLREPVAIFSRKVLNGLLLDSAREAGAEVIHDRVVRISGGAGAWRLESRGGLLEASFLVLAAGARNPFARQFSAPFAANDLTMTAGYYIARRSPLMQIQFVSGLHGYVWVFPRADHLSTGICGKLGGQSTSDLRKLLDRSLTALGLDFDRALFYAHVLPSLRAVTLRKNKVRGDGWAMIGDAAGFVDPITGEGLYYAMRSAELLSQALLADEPESYGCLLGEDLLPELEVAARAAEQFYSGRWMGQPVIDRMVQFTAHSRSFRALMCDLFSGTQGYRGLRQRLYARLPAMLAESLASLLRLPMSDEESRRIRRPAPRVSRA